MDWFAKAVSLAIAMVPTIKTKPFKNWTILNLDIFVRISSGFWQIGSHLSGFQMVVLFDHSEYGCVWIPTVFACYSEPVFPFVVGKEKKCKTKSG